MREDMHKVIVERPRGGWRTRRHKRKAFAGEDDLPMQIGMRRHVKTTGISSKYFSDHLEPLKRYFGSKLGRPWNDIYSELAAVTDTGSVVQNHVRQHIDSFVARHVGIAADGTWFVPTRHCTSGGPRWHQEYYVDPLDGVLKESRDLWQKLGLLPHRRRRETIEVDVREQDPLRELRRIDGVWYEVRFNEEPGAHPLLNAFDVLKREWVPRRKRHAIGKRQLSHRELKANGLENG